MRVKVHRDCGQRVELVRTSPVATYRCEEHGEVEWDKVTHADASAIELPAALKKRPRKQAALELGRTGGSSA